MRVRRAAAQLAANRAVPGIRWRFARWCAAPLAVMLALAVGFASIAAGDGTSSSADDRLTRVIVVSDGSSAAAEDAVRRAGGSVDAHIPLIHGVTADLPGSEVAALRAAPGVRSVTPDVTVSPLAEEAAPAPKGTTLELVRRAVGADALAERGITGTGVDVALIDTGVVPLPGMAGPEKVYDAPDFSSEGDKENLRGLDAFGHGTHLAGIIAANEPETGFSGVAPGARVVNVKVAAADGSTTLSQLLSGIDWTVRNRGRDGLNIRVLNIAFGAEVDGSYRTDPLAFAVEQAWKHGIVVVASAGNGGAELGHLDSPAHDPYVVAVGGDDPNGTPEVADDAVPGWSSRGDGTRNPDMVAPGTSIISYRVAGGYLDEQYPNAREGDVFFRGSGTSQAAAVVSGVAALILQAQPDLDPDQVKALLRSSAAPVPGADATAQGAGLVAADDAAAAEAGDARQKWQRASLGGGWRGGVVPRPELTDDGGEPSASRWGASRWGASRWGASRWGASRWGASRWGASRWGASRWGASRWGASRWGASRWGADSWETTAESP